MRRRVRWWVHNLLAHPLLVLCPPLGEWLHERTAPDLIHPQRIRSSEGP